MSCSFLKGCFAKKTEQYTIYIDNNKSGLAEPAARAANPAAKKKHLRAKREKNRSRKNAFAEVQPRGQKLGDRVVKNDEIRVCDGHERRSRV